MKHLLALSLALFVTPVLAAGLSPVAQKIYDTLKARPDIAAMCKDKDQLSDAVRSTVRGMIIAGEVEGRPRDDAKAAGAEIYKNCASFQPH